MSQHDDSLVPQRAFRSWWLARLSARTAEGTLLYGPLTLIADRTQQSIYSSLFGLIAG